MTPPIGFLKTWLIAVRPFAYTASVSAIVLGGVLVWHDDIPFHWDLFLLCFLGVISFHTGANLLSDRFDFQKGIDTEVLPTSGAIVRGLLTPTQITHGAWFFLMLGSIIGLILTAMTSWNLLIFGIIGAFIALTYTRNGIALKYRWLGDLAILIAFGPLPVMGIYWVQSGIVSWSAALWSLLLASYTVGILHANNWRDRERDSRVDCKTFAGLIGDQGSRWYYQFLVLAPFVGITLFAVLSGHFAVLLVFLVLPVVVKKLVIPARQPGPVLPHLDGLTAQVQVPFLLLLVSGLVIDKLLR